MSESLIEGLERLGFVRLERGNPRRYQKYGTWERGAVRVALSGNLTLAERGVVMKYQADEGEMSIEAIITDPAQRRQGLAKQAVKDILSIADASGTELYLEPVQMEVGVGPAAEQLKRFYASFGFEATDASGLVMHRKPNTALNAINYVATNDMKVISTPLGDAKTIAVDGKERAVFGSNGQPIHESSKAVKAPQLVEDVFGDQIQVNGQWYHALGVFGRHATSYKVGDIAFYSDVALQRTEVNAPILVQSSLFRESGANISHTQEMIDTYERAMREYGGWGQFPPAYGFVDTISSQDVQRYKDYADQGLAHELCYSRPITEDDIGLQYVHLENGHTRAYAASRAGYPLLVVDGSSDLRYSFAGEQAKGLSAADLERAKVLIAAGGAAQDVLRETGWFVGADGKWRFEISDDQAKALPLLGNEDARRVFTTALYDLGKGRLAKKSSQALKRAQSLQDALQQQRREIGGRRFTDPQLAKQLDDASDEVDAAFASYRQLLNQSIQSHITVGDVLDHVRLFAAYPALRDVPVVFLSSIQPGEGAFDYGNGALELSGKADAQQNLTALLHEMQHVIQYVEGFARGGSPQAVAEYAIQTSRSRLENAYSDLPSYKEAISKGDAAVRKWVQTAMTATGEGLTPYQAYRSLAGEVEARNTQARLTMTDEDRQNTPPQATQDTPTEDILVVFHQQDMGMGMGLAPVPALEFARAMHVLDHQRVRDEIEKEIGRDGLSRLIARGGLRLITSEQIKSVPQAARLSSLQATESEKAGTGGDVFISSLTKWVQANSSARAPAQAWLDQIQGAIARGQIKRDEVFWSGLQDWLGMQAGWPGKLSKAEVLQYLRDASVGVRIKQLSKSAGMSFDAMDLQQLDEAYTRIVGYSMLEDNPDVSEDELRDILKDMATEHGADEGIDELGAALPQYQKYIEDSGGAENYREVLLVLHRPNRVEQLQVEIDRLRAGRLPEKMSDEERFKLDGLVDLWEIERKRRQTRAYVSSHWSEPNVLAHFRVTDRWSSQALTIREQLDLQLWQEAQPRLKELESQIDRAARDDVIARDTRLEALRTQLRPLVRSGQMSIEQMNAQLDEVSKPAAAIEQMTRQRQELLAGLPAQPKIRRWRTLLVEEVQGDWGQEARKRGIAGAFPDDVLQAAIEGGMDPQQARADIDHLMQEPLETQDRPTGEQWKRLWDATEGSDVDLNEVFHSRRRDGVPAAPFIHSTDKWLSLALKSIVKMAVDEGYDRVAFVNGQQSRDRYDLSKTTVEISVGMRADERFVWLTAADGSNAELRVGPQGRILESKGGYEGKHLSHVIGPELAGKILASPEPMRLRNLDIKIGGEGLRAFYDDVVPATAKDLLRRMDASAVQPVRVDGVSGVQDQFGFVVTPKIRAACAEGVPLFSFGKRSGGAPSAQAFYDASRDSVSLIVDRIEPGQAMAVLLHEYAHKNMTKVIGTMGMQRLKHAVMRWRYAQADSVERQVFDSAYRRALKSQHFDEEIIAYAIEEAVKRGVCPDDAAPAGSVAKWLATVKGLFASVLTKFLGSEQAPELTAKDLVVMARGALGFALDDESPDSDEDLDIERIGEVDGVLCSVQDNSENAAPQYHEDIPNERWLQEKIDWAKSVPRNRWGVPQMSGLTGWFRQSVRVPMEWLTQVKGMRAEQSNVRPDDLAAIRAIMASTGRLPLTDAGKEYVPYIEIGYDGQPWVCEGNHRIMAAALEGFDCLAVDVRYYDGGQRQAGRWAPESLLSVHGQLTAYSILEEDNADAQAPCA